MPTKTNQNEYATKGDLRELRQEINQDFKIHMGVLYEKFSDDVKVIAEQHLDTDRKIDKIDRRLEKVEVSLEKVEVRLEKVEDRLEKVEDKIDVVVEAVGEIKTDLTGTKERVEKLESAIATH